jgi:hypothetical protein
LVITEEQVPDPNGLCFSPDYKTLYVASTGKGPGDTGPGGKGEIYSFDVGTDNKLSNRKLFSDCMSTASSAARRPALRRLRQSLGLEQCRPQRRLQRRHGVDAGGKLIGRIRLPEICGNVCFGGPSATACSWRRASRLYAVFWRPGRRPRLAERDQSEVSETALGAADRRPRARAGRCGSTERCGARGLTRQQRSTSSTPSRRASGKGDARRFVEAAQVDHEIVVGAGRRRDKGTNRSGSGLPAKPKPPKARPWRRRDHPAQHGRLQAQQEMQARWACRPPSTATAVPSTPTLAQVPPSTDTSGKTAR